MRLLFALSVLVLLCACSQQDSKPAVVVVDTPTAPVSAPHFIRTPTALKAVPQQVDLGPGSYPAPHPKEWGGAAFDPVAFDKWLLTHNPRNVESRKPP